MSKLRGHQSTSVSVFLGEHVHHVNSTMDVLVGVQEPQRCEDLNELSLKEALPHGRVAVGGLGLPDDLEIALVVRHDQVPFDRFRRGRRSCWRCWSGGRSAVHRDGVCVLDDR